MVTALFPHLPNNPYKWFLWTLRTMFLYKWVHVLSSAEEGAEFLQAVILKVFKDQLFCCKRRRALSSVLGMCEKVRGLIWRCLF